MHLTGHTARLAASAGACSLILLVTPAYAQQGIPQGTTTQEWKALLIRGDALNQRYHLGAYARQGIPQGTTAQEWKALVIRGDALNQRYHLGAYATGHADDLRALRVRGQALNTLYGNAWTRLTPGQFATLMSLFGSGVTQFSPRTLQAFFANVGAQDAIGRTLHGGPASSGFAWRDAGIGALAALGAILISAAIATARTRSHRTKAIATPATS